MISKTDLRIVKTNENIKNAFCNLLLEKNFKDITVQNICDEALIGRSTFYDHYSDKYDLLNKMVEELSNEFKPYIKIRFNLNNINDFTTTFSGMLKHLSKEKTKILALLNVHTEFADLHSNLENLLIKGCMDFLLNENFKSKFNISNEYICRHYASYVLTSFELWLELDESDGALELANNMQAILFAN